MNISDKETQEVISGFFFIGEEKPDIKTRKTRSLKSYYPVEGNGARRGRIQMAGEGHFTRIMGLKDSGVARFMLRQGSFDAVTLESP